MAFHLGPNSRRELVGVHPVLFDMVTYVIGRTTQDFSVHDGLRTSAEQELYVTTGVSHTMKSKHLRQEDGFGHAVDLVPYINGKLRWEWPAIYPIAEAMRQVATELGVPVVWGGCWQVITGTNLAPELLVAEYVDKRRRQGRKAFPDGPHFELKM